MTYVISPEEASADREYDNDNSPWDYSWEDDEFQPVPEEDWYVNEAA